MELFVYSYWNQWLYIKMEESYGFNTQVPNNLHFIISPGGTAKIATKRCKMAGFQHREGTLNLYLDKLLGLASNKQARKQTKNKQKHQKLSILSDLF